MIVIGVGVLDGLGLPDPGPAFPPVPPDPFDPVDPSDPVELLPAFTCPVAVPAAGEGTAGLAGAGAVAAVVAVVVSGDAELLAEAPEAQPALLTSATARAAKMDRRR